MTVRFAGRPALVISAIEHSHDSPISAQYELRAGTLKAIRLNGYRVFRLHPVWREGERERERGREREREGERHKNDGFVMGSRSVSVLFINATSEVASHSVS